MAYRKPTTFLVYKLTMKKPYLFPDFLITFLFYVIPVHIFAQTPPPIQWQKSLGGSGNESISDAIPLAEGGYALMVLTNSTDGDLNGVSGAGTGKCWFVKSDETGNIIHDTILSGFEGNPRRLEQASDGGFWIMGDLSQGQADTIPFWSGVSYNGGASDGFVIKTDNNFNVQWKKFYGDTLANGFYGTPTSDGGLILAGSTIYPAGTLNTYTHDYNNGYVIKIDPSGNVQHSRTFGGTQNFCNCSSGYPNYQYGDQLRNIIQTSDGGYAVIGIAASTNGDITNYLGGNYDIWVLKLNDTLGIEWSKNYGGEGQEEYSLVKESIIELEDGNFVISGWTQSSDVPGIHGTAGDVYMAKISSSDGSIIWQRAYGGNGAEAAGTRSLAKIPDGNILLVSDTKSGNTGDVTGFHGTVSWADRWMVKINQNDGGIIWQKAYGGTRNDAANVAISNPDGSLTSIGITNSVTGSGDVVFNYGNTSNVWILTLGACPAFATIEATTCANEPYDFNGTFLSTSGTYTDTFVNQYSCDSIVTLNLTVTPLDVTPLMATICQGESYSFASQTLTAADIYYDTLTSAVTGCDSIIELTLTVNPVYEIPFSESICEGESYLFGAANLTTAGIYHDTLQSVNACDSVLVLTLTVNPLPAPVVTANGPELNTGSFTTYQWNLNGTAIPGAEGQTYTATENGSYTVTVTDANACEETSDPQVVNTVGLEELALFQNLIIFPNPAHNALTISFTQEGIYTLSDLNGRTIQAAPLDASGNTVIDLSSVDAGIYTLSITTKENQTAVTKVVKN